jgi:hypothetical protein
MCNLCVPCVNSCCLLVCMDQSIPVGMNITPDIATHDAWIDLLNNANKTVNIAAFYFTLTDGMAARTLTYFCILVVGLFEVQVSAFARLRRPPCRCCLSKWRIWTECIQCDRCCCNAWRLHSCRGGK